MSAGFRLLQWLLAVLAVFAATQFVMLVVAPRVAAADVVADLAQAKIDYATVPDMADWSAQRITAYVARDIGLEPLGVLKVARLGLASPIYAGTSDAVLNAGVGWVAGTGVPGQAGNAGLAGHRDGFFRGLKDIAEGDVIQLSTLAGDTRYRVTDMEIVAPEKTSVLRQTRSAQLTLITCYPFYFVGSAPERYIIHAVAEALN